MSDAFEDRTRELAHSLPLCDFGSSQAILAMAQAFREDAAECARLREALEPLSDLLTEMLVDGTEDLPDGTQVTIQIGSRTIFYGAKLADLRRALDALKDPSHD